MGRVSFGMVGDVCMHMTHVTPWGALTCGIN